MIGELIAWLAVGWFLNHWDSILLAFCIIGLAVVIQKVAEKRRT